MRRLVGCALCLHLAVGCGAETGTGTTAVGADARAAAAADASSNLADAAPTSTDAATRPADAAPKLHDAIVAGADAAVAVGDAGPRTPDALSPIEVIPAADYCEAVVDFFCEFYVRCGRMAVDGVEACRSVFLSACNAGYEPQYVAHEHRNLLALSTAGIEACRAHLADVSCDAQVFDLDGACARMWVGLAPVGAACAPGIGSFVCAPGATCVLDLSFCGTCEAAARTGEACGPEAGDLRCDAADRCAAGRCVPRTAPGDACAADEDCVVAAACVEGTCRTFERARLGEACAADRRCPYHSTCRGGRCEVNRTLGEACAPGDVCDAGRCVDGVCVALGGEDASCTENAGCLSGACTRGGLCEAPISDCLR